MSTVMFDPDTRLWLLHGGATAYAVRLAEDDTVRHVHWGPPVSLDQAIRLPERTSPALSSFEAQAGMDELAAEGGARFGPSSLLVRFADGGRGVEWRYLRHDARGGHLRIELADRHYPVRLTLHYRMRGDVLERWTTVENVGDREPVTVLRCDSAAWAVPDRPDYRVSHLVGGWNSEFQLRRTPVPVAETVFTSRRGLTGPRSRSTARSGAPPWPGAVAGG